MKIKAVTLLLTFITSTAVVVAQQRAYPIDSILQAQMKAMGVVGGSAAVLVNKELAWSKAYGYADLDRKLPFTTGTIINIASITKTITGACLMRAVEAHKLSLDKDINRYLPFKVINPWFPKEKITLRNLATHTSGIVDQEPLYDHSYHNGGDSPQKLDDFLKNYFDPAGKSYQKENFLKARPGAVYTYSNIGAALAGYIIERVTGQPLNVYSKHVLFEPLKMNSTGWFLTEIDTARHSRLYNLEGDRVHVIPWYGLTTYPDGGVRTTVLDLAKFLTCIANNGGSDGHRLFQPATVQELLRPEFTETDKPENLNLETEDPGIFWSVKAHRTRVGHNGQDPGVRTKMFYDTANQTGIILFVNTGISEDQVNALGAELWKYAQWRKEHPAR